MNSRTLAKLTEVATEIDYLKSLRREIPRNLYQRELKKLQKREKSLKEDLEQERRSREVARQMAIEEARKKKKREEAALAKLKRNVNVLFERVIGDDPINDIVDAWKATSNVDIMRVITPGYDYQVFSTAQSKDFVRQFFIGGNSQADMIVNEGNKLLIVAPTNIPAVKLRQMFREGISNCVFTPILKKLSDAFETTTSKDRKKRLGQRISKLKDMEEVYANGVPEDKMEDVAKASGFKITIHNILGKEMNVYNEHGKCGAIKFTNTKPNHVDEGKIALDQDFEIVSEDTIVSLWAQAQKQKDFYMIEGDIKNGVPSRLRLLDKAYRVKDVNEDYFDRMNEKIDFNKYRFNATKYPEVNEFMKAGRIINSWVCPFSTDVPTGHLDMPKAYAQFKKCDWYTGFMGVVHQFRSGNFDRNWITEKIGIYRFKVLSSNSKLFEKLGLVVGTTHILPSPEILYFMDKGVEVSIDAGVWGSRMDFEFDDEMLADRRYCLWSGRLGMERQTRNFSFSASPEWASHLKADYGDDCYYWQSEKICSVRVPVKTVMTTHHILAFITSYVRIQMMEAMSKFRIDQLVRVVMDGIYFVGEKPMGLEWFKEKDIAESSRAGFEWYSDEILNVEFPPVLIGGNALLTGQGGAGKTYKVMNAGGFNRILFVSPQHVLGSEIAKSYNIPYTTIHKLIGEDCRPYKDEHAYPPVLFIDEVTQIAASWIDKVFDMYKDSLIILAGDLNEKGIWFQTRNGHPGNFSCIWKPHDVEIIHVAGDRRSRDDKLRELKLRIRGIMERSFIDGDSGEHFTMQLWAKKNLPLTSFDDAVKMFQPGDCWIAGTHKTSDKLLENGVCSGWYKRGGNVSFVEKEGYNKRGSFTVHAYQGRTVDVGKIFISIGDLFEYSMFYTAVSRAVNFDQLVFVV